MRQIHNITCYQFREAFWDGACLESMMVPSDWLTTSRWSGKHVLYNAFSRCFYHWPDKMLAQKPSWQFETDKSIIRATFFKGIVNETTFYWRGKGQKLWVLICFEQLRLIYRIPKIKIFSMKFNDTRFFYKNRLYKNIRTEICPKIKNKLRTITRLKFWSDKFKKFI